jgi:nucleoside-diphosphate-sugar epimerase
MKVFVTGANGLIGASVVPQLLETGHEVVALVRNSSGISRGHHALHWVIGDIRDEKTLVENIRGCDVVVHLAAKKADEQDSRSVNVEGTRNVVHAAQKAQCLGLIHISTISTKFKVRGTYGATKAEADEIVRSAVIPHVILKLSVVYADTKTGIVGSLARYTGLPFVPLFGPGTAVYRPVYVEDVSRAIQAVLARPFPAQKEFEVGGPQEVSLNEVTEIIAQEVHGRDPRIIHFPVWLGLLAARIFSFLPRAPITRSNIVGMNEIAPVDTREFVETYGWHPMTLAQGLRSALAKERARDRESVAIMHYVARRPVSDYYVSFFERALEKHGLPLDSVLPRNHFLLGGLDALSALIRKDTTLRRKLILAAAIYEASPLSADDVLPKGRPIIAAFFVLMKNTATFAVKILIGLFLRFTKTYG